MGLVLHCKLKYRVWPHAHISRLRLKIFFTPKYLPKRPHGTKFRQNPRNGGSQRLHEIENLSVKCDTIYLPFLQVYNIDKTENLSIRRIGYEDENDIVFHPDDSRRLIRLAGPHL